MTLERFNQIRNAHFAETEANVSLIEKLNALGVTEDEIKALPYVKPFPRGFHELRQAVSDIKKSRKGNSTSAVKATAPKAEKKTETASKYEPKTDNSAEQLIKALNSVLKAPALNEEQIKAIIQKTVADQVAEQLKNHETVKKIEVKTARGVNTVTGTTHKCFNAVLAYLENNQNVYLYGPAGTGKTHLASQVAEALGLDFYYSGQLSQEYKFTGFTDANGRYQETAFYKAFVNGGLFFFDEIGMPQVEMYITSTGYLYSGHMAYRIITPPSTEVWLQLDSLYNLACNM